MDRYAIKYVNASNGIVMYDAIGKGASADPQDAHLYTRYDLAEKKAQSYRKGPQWWKDVEIVTVRVVWPPAPVVVRCPAKLANGGNCPHHNLHCGWPQCNEIG